MRISDWSSDVCSSDLRFATSVVQPFAHFLAGLEIGHAFGVHRDRSAGARIAAGARFAGSRREGAEAAQLDPAAGGEQVGRASCRESVGQYVYISVVAVA